MSIYETVETAFTDLDMLVEAIEAAGLGDQVKVYEHEDGVYRKWAFGNSRNKANNTGQIRGKDAAVVIHGGLDSTGWVCGDTAFVRDPETGRYDSHIDVAHGNAPENWRLIKDNYAALMVEKTAAKNGLRCERSTNEQGKIVLRVYPKTGARLVRQTVRG